MVKLFYIKDLYKDDHESINIEIFTDIKVAKKQFLQKVIASLAIGTELDDLTNIKCVNCNFSMVNEIQNIYSYEESASICICVDCIEYTTQKHDNADYIKSNYYTEIDHAIKDDFYDNGDRVITIEEYGDIRIKENEDLRLENVQLKASVEHYKSKWNGYEQAKKYMSFE